jgi:hypothetical protein
MKPEDTEGNQAEKMLILQSPLNADGVS